MLFVMLILLFIALTTSIVVGIIFYLLFRFAHKVTNPIKRIWFWIGSILVSGTCSVILGLYFFLFGLPASDNFTEEKWKQMPNERVLIVDDLLERGLLNNKTKEDVVLLLGEPLVNCPYFLDSKMDMIYNLGPERSLNGVDDAWLLIWLNENRVLKYEVKTD